LKFQPSCIGNCNWNFSTFYFADEENDVSPSVGSGRNVLLVGRENILISIEEDEDEEQDDE
jgi:hypothetical protein